MAYQLRFGVLSGMSSSHRTYRPGKACVTHWSRRFIIYSCLHQKFCGVFSSFTFFFFFCTLLWYNFCTINYTINFMIYYKSLVKHCSFLFWLVKIYSIGVVVFFFFLGGGCCCCSSCSCCKQRKYKIQILLNQTLIEIRDRTN